MATIKVKAKNQIDIGKKSRVYFCCHPDDFDRFFKRICDDIFQTQDCAIYYTEDMAAAFAEEDLETDLGRNNLFVVPVTLQLLTTPNRAMDHDIPFARQAHIPVLPFMMEPGIDEFYAKSENFGNLQYLNPNSVDPTEMPYDQKLKNYLTTVLISNDLMERIRSAFDVYVFLSYRKKDRRYANELMRLIHSNPKCRDIAIWFDEFLTPGENFRESIDKILTNSRLFVLLVTPNLLEEPNFVMEEEYPAAQNSGIEILPAEMVETDYEILRKKYWNIPHCINPYNQESRTRFLESVVKVATETSNTPEHNYLVGLAYLDGIDVEIDHEYALELITAAAEADLPEAMSKLCILYYYGIGTKIDYQQVANWTKRLADYSRETYGDNDPKTLRALSHLATAYGLVGDYRKAMDLGSQVFDDQYKLLGLSHPDTLNTMTDLAITLQKLSNLSNIGASSYSLTLKKKVYEVLRDEHGEDHPRTIDALFRLANTYGHSGRHKKALELSQKVYHAQCRLFEEDDPLIVATLQLMSAANNNLRNYQSSLKLTSQVYTIQCKKFGEAHPDTLKTLTTLAHIHGQCGDHQKALQLHEQVYDIYRETLGEEHPATIDALEARAGTNSALGNHQKTLELQEQVYALRCKIYGEDHWKTDRSKRGLAMAYDRVGQIDKTIKIYRQVIKNYFCIVKKLFSMPRKERFDWLMENFNTNPKGE